MTSSDQVDAVTVTIQVPSIAPDDLIARLTAMAAELGAHGGIDHVFLEIVRTCRTCGCTEERACFGGCWWVNAEGQPDLCSSCAPDAPEGVQS